MDLTKTMLEEINNIREKSSDQCLLINKNESYEKFNDILTLLSSYLLCFPMDLDSFEWLFSLKYYSNTETKQISIQVIFKNNSFFFS